MDLILNGTIADVDSTTPLDQLHPAIVLVVDAGGPLQQVVVPNTLLNGDLVRFRIGAHVEVIASPIDRLAVGEIALVAVKVTVGTAADRP